MLTGGCDFCGPRAEAVLIFPAEPIVRHLLDHPGAALHVDGRWAACQTCSVQIIGEQWDELTDRAVRAFQTEHPEHAELGPLLRSEMHALHEAFRDARTDAVPEPALWEPPADGPVLVVGDDIPDTAPHAVREGYARRSLVNSGQPCPCGAQLLMPNRAARRRAARAGQVLHITVEHTDDCPATNEQLAAAVVRWKETTG